MMRLLNIEPCGLTAVGVQRPAVDGQEVAISS
jgi:hypothetical protein